MQTFMLQSLQGLLKVIHRILIIALLCKTNSQIILWKELFFTRFNCLTILFLSFLHISISFMHHANIIAQSTSLFVTCDRLNLIKDLHRLISLVVLFVTHSQIGGYFQKQLTLLVRSDVICSLIISQSCSEICLFVQNKTNVEICLDELHVVHRFDLVRFHVFIFLDALSNCIYEKSVR